MISVRKLLSRKGSEVATISPKATVKDALTQMAQKGIWALLVLQGGELTGIITERDYARKVILMGRTSKDTRVGEDYVTQPDHRLPRADRHGLYGADD